MKTPIRLGLALALGLGACASVPPPLAEARKYYKVAEGGVANELVPDKVLEAKQALVMAEKAYDEDDESFEAESMAYIATRKAKLAIAEGGRASAEKKMRSIDDEYVETQGALLKEARAAARLHKTRLDQQTRELAAERRARRAAEGQLGAAVSSLREIASVREDPRGVVITLDGAVLFPAGKVELLPIAKQRLVRVAQVLREQGDDKAITIEGHTDSRGSSRKNLAISERRAQAVRDHLIRLGVSADRIQAVGRGSGFPVASNRTPDGRANNRRVEIIVKESPADQG